MTQFTHDTAPTQYVEADGIRFAYRRFGAPERTPLVFFQHFMGTLDDHDPALSDAFATDREVILFNNTGVASSSGLVPDTIEAMARDAISLIDALGLTTVDLVGHSMGGLVVQEVALARPDLVRRLVLVGTGPRGGEGIGASPAWVAELFTRKYERQEDMWLPILFAPSEASQAAGQTPGEARQRLADAATGARENATLKGQIVSLHRDLASVGRGGDFPPCWVTGGGEIQYLFRVTLNATDSLTVADITPAERLADRRALPLAALLFAGPVSRRNFLGQTQALYDQSRARGCRYYVTIADRTGPTQKDLFKSLLFTVEAHFYKVILR